MKKIYAILALLLLLAGCGSSSPAPETKSTPEPEKPKEILFDSDEVVNVFLMAYNSTAEITIPIEEVERGNIKTKALVYMDDLHFEIVHVNNPYEEDADYLSLSIGADPENEETKLRAVFRDVIVASRPEISEEDVASAWEEIRATGYMVEDYAMKDMTITYIPHKRIDIKIPLN